jgi:hypothetical protein
VTPLQRKASINGAITAAVTELIGFSVLSSSGSGLPTAPTPPPTSSTSAPPACAPAFEVLPTVDPKDGGNLLLGVSALSATDAWAVGGSGDPVDPTQTLYEHWDGETWTAVDGPNPGITLNELAAVDQIAADVWAVGSLIQHFAGDTWVERGTLRDGTDLRGIASVGANDVWAVGFRSNTNDTARAVVRRWDGGQWSSVAGEHTPGQETLAAVTALPDGTVIAVGSRDVATGRATLAIRGADCLG